MVINNGLLYLVTWNFECR